ESGAPETREHERLERDLIVEVAGDDRRRFSPALRLLDDLPQLSRSQFVVAAAFEVQIVKGDTRRPRPQCHAPAAPRLHRTQTPSKRCLFFEHDHGRIENRFATEDRLSRNGWTAAGGFADLLKLAAARPVHVQSARQLARDVAIAAALAVTIDLLKQDDIRREVSQG